MGASKRLLVVDDETIIRDLLQRNLSREGYDVLTAANGHEALQAAGGGQIAAVLLDLKMPGMSGIDVLRELALNYPELGVIMITAIDDTGTAVEAMKLGAYDYITKPFNLDQVFHSVSRALEKRRLLLENREYKRHLEEEVARQTDKIRLSFFNALQSLSYALEAKDRYTSGHSQRVADIVVAMAAALGLAREDIERLKQAALVHDIGKIGVKEAVLDKTTRLTLDEMRHIRLHPEIGEHILAPVTDDTEILKAVRNHHERFDGAGYPDRMKGKQIPLKARILAVADAYEAMTSERPYRSAMSAEVAFTELTSCKNTQFDPEAVEAFLEVARNSKAPF